MHRGRIGKGLLSCPGGLTPRLLVPFPSLYNTRTANIINYLELMDWVFLNWTHLKTLTRRKLVGNIQKHYSTAQPTLLPISDHDPLLRGLSNLGRTSGGRLLRIILGWGVILQGCRETKVKRPILS